MTEQRVDVTVSIVNWNTKEELSECLKSVLAQDSSVTYEIIVVDNASTDDSVDMLRAEFDQQITLIENPTNEGFGAAHNKALKQSNGRYVFVLNPDCRLLGADMLQKMINYLDDNRDIGMLGPKITNPDGTLQFSARRFPTMFAGVFRHTIFGRLFPKNRYIRDYLMIDFTHEQISDVDWLSGAALVVRRETFEQIGLFDERFFMYCEDVDWCKRAHLSGWRVVYFPIASVTHRIGAASDKNPIPMIKQHHRSMLRYFLKYNARSLRILLTPVVMFALWLRAQSLINRARPHN